MRFPLLGNVYNFEPKDDITDEELLVIFSAFLLSQNPVVLDKQMVCHLDRTMRHFTEVKDG